MAEKTEIRVSGATALLLFASDAELDDPNCTKLDNGDWLVVFEEAGYARILGMRNPDENFEQAVARLLEEGVSLAA